MICLLDATANWTDTMSHVTVSGVRHAINNELTNSSLVADAAIEESDELPLWDTVGTDLPIDNEQ